MPSQAMRQLSSRMIPSVRCSIPHILSLSLPQTIFANVSGMPFPVGVTGTVAQNKPNTQPEE